MELNQSQLKAVQTIDRNLAVTAGAGTGKTKVLTERYIYLLEHGDLEEYKEIESIVAITFTNKATQEMVERIRQEIKNNIPKGNEWRRFYRDLEMANISTIHGFCAKILRENPMEAKVDPYFEVLDDVVSSQLLAESIHNVLNIRLENDENTFKMMTLLNQNRIENIASDIQSLYSSVQTVGISFNQVKQDTVEYLDSLEVKLEYLDEIKDLIKYLIGKSRKNSKLYKIQENQIWLDFVKGNFSEDDIYNHVQFIKDNLGTMKNEEETIDRVNYLLDTILLSKEKEYLWVYETLADILIEIDNTYILKKREVGGLDYDDLQNMVLELLDNQEILEKYQNKYRYFMIDEFQDTNELQKKIFYKLATVKEPLDRHNLFIVGDPKQSIYGFRGADIDVFYNVIKDITKDNKGEAITLKDNYRSYNTILTFVNDVFSKIMKDKYDELLFNKESKNDIDIEILQDDENRSSEECSVYEAQAIAKRIKTLVQEGRYQYKDIALLFRSSTRNHIYEEAFKDYNIPYYNSSSKRFFNRQEILDIINGLKTISNPYDNIAAIGFLRGPMIGLKDTTIYWLLKYLDKNLYNTILKVKENPIFPDEEKEKLDEAAEILGYLYKVKNLYSVSEILNLLIEKTLFVETSLLKTEGNQIVANIYKFIEMTNEYYNENNNSLEDYIDYIEKMKASQESEGVIQSEEDDVVKLITIHSSKGLQFPVVIIPEMAKGSGGFPPKMLYNKDIGIGIKTEEAEGIYNKINDIKKVKENEEAERVLYVAITRAEEMLILGCYGKSSGFKKLINDILPENQIRLISDIELEKEMQVPVLTINQDLLCENGDTHRAHSGTQCRTDVSSDIPTPLLYGFDSFNTKEFISYNISQYQKFNQCNRKFYLEYYWGLNINIDNEDDEIEDVDPNLELEEDATPLSGITKGNIVHKFAQLYRYSTDRDELLHEIVNSYGLDHSDEVDSQLRPYIDNYLKYYNEDYDELYSERLFHLKIGNKYIKGVIDRITIKDNDIEILDFKSNRVWNKNQLIKFYEPQLKLYAYAVEKILGKRVSKASILFLETGFKGDVDISEDSLEDNFNRIGEFIKFVENHKDLESYKEAHKCDEYCRYKEFCKR
ncbi:MAG: UvrD-helicase domain-containing protein [Tissierellaceae bacterium]|nr:UvrD-helicase domain-containing protein [Tissierellaceae bacterium]